MKVKKIEEMEQIHCGDCKNYFKLSDNIGACVKKIKLVYATWNCPYAEKGENTQDIEKLIELYYQYSEAVKLFNEAKETLRQILLSKLENNQTVGNFRIKIKTVSQKRLDIQKTRKFLKEIGRLEEFTKEVTYQTLIVKRI